MRDHRRLMKLKKATDMTELNELEQKIVGESPGQLVQRKQLKHKRELSKIPEADQDDGS